MAEALTRGIPAGAVAGAATSMASSQSVPSLVSSR